MFSRSSSSARSILTSTRLSQLCVAFYTVGPTWLADRGRRGRDIANLDGEILRLTWSWKPGTTVWLVLAGEPVHQELRSWALNFPMLSFPTAEGARLFRLDASVRDAVFPSAR